MFWDLKTRHILIIFSRSRLKLAHRPSVRFEFNKYPFDINKTDIFLGSNFVSKLNIMSDTKVWYITGASKGMGLAIAKQLLTKGHRVAATSRSIEAFDQLVNFKDRFLPLEVDLKSEVSIAESIKETVDMFGSIDVVVNNAGYGLGGRLKS